LKMIKQHLGHGLAPRSERGIAISHYFLAHDLLSENRFPLFGIMR
jgi:hypothetical protein